MSTQDANKPAEGSSEQREDSEEYPTSGGDPAGTVLNRLRRDQNEHRFIEGVKLLLIKYNEQSCRDLYSRYIMFFAFWIMEARDSRFHHVVVLREGNHVTVSRPRLQLGNILTAYKAGYVRKDRYWDTRITYAIDDSDDWAPVAAYVIGKGTTYEPDAIKDIGCSWAYSLEDDNRHRVRVGEEPGRRWHSTDVDSFEDVEAGIIPMEFATQAEYEEEFVRTSPCTASAGT